MSDTLQNLLRRNSEHAGSLAENHFDEVQEVQEPEVVSVCCSDSRVSQESMWSVEEAGWLFTPSTVGGQVWDIYEGDKVVDGSVVYPLEYTGTRTAVVVGHTGCGAVTAALDSVQGEDADYPAGVRKWVETLVPVVEDGLEQVSNDPDEIVDRLVQHNVDTQVGFLLDSDDVPDDIDVYGFVYDLHGVYGDERGRAYLVNSGGTTDVSALRDEVPEEYEDTVERL